jgi:uncharacterized protein YegP (UPF0339 family)
VAAGGNYPHRWRFNLYFTGDWARFADYLAVAENKTLVPSLWVLAIPENSLTSNNKGGRRKLDAKFELNKDVMGKFIFKLVTENGQTLAISEGYSTKESALSGIASVKQNAAETVVKDMTV